MICSIILRIPKKLPCVIYVNNNFYETLNEFENLAMDSLKLYGGENIQIIDYNKLNEMKRGFYLVKEYNKFKLYRKDKNGYFYNSEPVLLKEFEFISCYFKSGYEREAEEKEKKFRKNIFEKACDIFISEFLEMLNKSEKMNEIKKNFDGTTQN